MSIIDNEAYIKSPNKCPLKECRSDDITGSSVEIDGAFATQEVTCNECGAEWEDTYQLASFTI